MFIGCYIDNLSAAVSGMSFAVIASGYWETNATLVVPLAVFHTR
jgi:hypothetical protein